MLIDLVGGEVVLDVFKCLKDNVCVIIVLMLIVEFICEKVKLFGFEVMGMLVDLNLE